MEQRDIKEALKTCGFTDPTHRNFIVHTKNFSCWGSFTLVNFDALTTLRATVTFNISVTKLFCFAILKFLIEDKIRMNEPHFASQFRQDIDQYFQLYQTFVTAKNNSNLVPHGPQFSSDDWNGFKTGTKDYLGLILGSGGVPLSYVIRGNADRPIIASGSSRHNKIY